MKRSASIALFALVSFATVGFVSAQERAVKADVPFDFTVGNKLVPAGAYTISAVWDNVIEIQNRDAHVALLSRTNPDDKQSKNGKLVFTKYGDQYFLSEILCTSADMNMAVPASKAEQRAHDQQASLQNATQVYVALK